MKIRTAFLAGAALASAAAPVMLAEAQTVIEQVRKMVEDRADVGESLVGEIETAELEASESKEFYFEIDPTKTYFVYGACDDDCTDIDLQAHDADETVVDVDDEDDNAPLLLILPEESGKELHVVIELYGCETETCVVGLGLYQVD